MSKFKDLCEAVISKGLLKAMSNPLRTKAICPGCGYVLPKYPGKYCRCPLCNKKIVQVTKPVEDPDQDGGQLVPVDDESITPDEEEVS